MEGKQNAKGGVHFSFSASLLVSSCPSPSLGPARAYVCTESVRDFPRRHELTYTNGRTVACRLKWNNCDNKLLVGANLVAKTFRELP